MTFVEVPFRGFCFIWCMKGAPLFWEEPKLRVQDFGAVLYFKILGCSNVFRGLGGSRGWSGAAGGGLGPTSGLRGFDLWGSYHRWDVSPKSLTVLDKEKNSWSPILHTKKALRGRIFATIRRTAC